MPAVPPSVSVSARANVQPQFLVVIDAAHGGNDPGASLNEKLVEKDLTLALTLRLRATLNENRIQVITTRVADAPVSMVARAEIANHALAAACITLHATSTGTGVHLFTSSLAPTPNGRFLPWLSAQSASVTQSLRLSSDINTALGHVAVPVILGRTSLQPLDSFACPAVAIEIAPLTVPASGNSSTKPAALTDDAYQKKIVDALAAALVQWQNEWRQQP